MLCHLYSLPKHGKIWTSEIKQLLISFEQKLPAALKITHVITIILPLIIPTKAKTTKTETSGCGNQRTCTGAH